MIGNKSETILITGINGFLGKHLALKLSKYYDVIGLEKNPGAFPFREHLNLKIYSSTDNLSAIFIKHKISVVIHTAVIYRPENDSVIQLLNTNLTLPILLIELCKKYQCNLFINTDSFFNKNKANYSYLEVYTLSKKHSLAWLTLLHSTIKLVNMQLFHVYGPNDSEKKFVPWILSELVSNTREINLTKGEQIRDFVFIEDVTNAYLAILQNYKILKQYTSFEVGTGIETSIHDFICTAKTITKSASNLNFGALENRKHEIMKAVANPTQLKKIGWEPGFTIDQGIFEIYTMINRNIE